MDTALHAVLPVAALAVIMGTAIGWDRWREPRRSLTRPFAVVDR